MGRKQSGSGILNAEILRSFQPTLKGQKAIECFRQERHTNWIHILETHHDRDGVRVG